MSETVMKTIESTNSEYYLAIRILIFMGNNHMMSFLSQIIFLFGVGKYEKTKEESLEKWKSTIQIK